MIPAAAMPETVVRQSFLLYVRFGEAHVTVDGDRTLVEAAHAHWVPAGRRCQVKTSAGTSAVPIVVPGHETGRWRYPATIAIPERWDLWLLHHYAKSLGFLHGDSHPSQDLLEFVYEGIERKRTVTYPPLPESAPARVVARHLLSDPAARGSLGDLAAMVGVSVRTLHRQFVCETGASPRRWLTQARLASAAIHLHAGRSVAWTATEVGFKTSSAFVHAFAGQIGVTPARFRKASLLPRSVGCQPSIPAGWTVGQRNGFHVALWACRGQARITLRSAMEPLDQGTVRWLPAGVHHRLETEPGSVVLPVDWRLGGEPVPSQNPITFGKEPSAYDKTARLLAQSVDRYTTLRMLDGDNQPATQCVTTLDRQVERLLRRVSRFPADTKTLTQWATEMDVPAGVLRAAIRARTGTNLNGWRAMARMSIARELLGAGFQPYAVARKLGYASISTFSRSFTAAHGLPPRAFQRAAVDTSSRRG